MSGKKYSMVLTIILILIIAVIAGLLGFLIYNTIEKDSSIKEASDFVDSFVETSAISQEEEKNNNQQSGGNNIIEQNIIEEPNVNNNTIPETQPETNTTKQPTTTTATKTMYKGFETIGTIEIPKTNIKYPILNQLSIKSLDTSVVAVYPRNPVLNSVGNVVIQGHNYRNGKFFSNNKQLNIGDKIYITDLNGKKVTYVIYNKFETSVNDTKPYNKDTNGAREITLSTCVDAANDQRLIIEARAQ